jgi:RimJ/RimL family protein N-acetyltransferase
LATEAALASVRYGFVTLGLKRIIGLAMPQNVASIRVLEKAGLHYTEEVSFLGHRFSKYAISPESAQPASDRCVAVDGTGGIDARVTSEQ